MKKVLKWIGIIVAGLIGLVVIIVVGAWGSAQYRMNRTYNIAVEELTIPSDSATIERGGYLANSVSTCIGCHDKDFGGKDFFNDPAIGRIYSANLTAGQGGKGATYSDEDWVRALRHGVGPDGKPLMIMPSQNFHRLSDADLAAVIAYIKTVPPVDRVSPDSTLTFMAQVLFGLGQFGEFPAEIIERGAVPQSTPAQGVSAEYGEYVAWIAGCRDCHGPDLTGGTPGPGEPFAPNLTPGGQLLVWTEEDFITAFRTGETPQGMLDPDEMPIKEYQMTDDDLRALFLYLKSLPGGQAE
jgi:cytochrome c553